MAGDFEELVERVAKREEKTVARKNGLFIRSNNGCGCFGGEREGRDCPAHRTHGIAKTIRWMDN
jgi:hypothetical protein